MDDIAKPKQPMYVARLYNRFRGYNTLIDVFVHENDPAIGPSIELAVRRDPQSWVVAYLTPEDGDALIEAIRKAVALAREAVALAHATTGAK
jgi:hypothetical protein